MAVSGLALLAGCPDSPNAATTPAPPPGTTPARPDAPPPPPPPPPRPTEGWGAVGVGSSFETVTRIKYDNPELPGGERTTIQTVVGFDPDGVRVKTVTRFNGEPEPESEPAKFAFKALAADPEAKKPETTKETLVVQGKSYECEVTTEKQGDSTVRTWRTKSLPVPVKMVSEGDGLQSTAELVKVDLK
ncbi:MAG: hypothetical protein ACAI25_17870 [Planctomycetota bacterium]